MRLRVHEIMKKKRSASSGITRILNVLAWLNVFTWPSLILILKTFKVESKSKLIYRKKNTSEMNCASISKRFVLSELIFSL